MSIVTMQRRLVEVGRIRMGEKRVSQSGKTYPAKLSEWRLTSPDRQRLDAAAAVYGGTVGPWEGQFELKTETAALDIALIPGQVLTQHFELWGQRLPKNAKQNPVLCLRRCDGQFEVLSEKPCLCLAENGEDGPLVCKPTTHLLVILRRVPGIGAWRLATRGWYAAQELAGTAALLEQLTARGTLVPARLRLDQRTSVTETETRNYVVPVIDIDATLDEVLAPLGNGGRAGVLEGNGHGVRELEAPSFEPVPVADLSGAPERSVREQALAPPVERAPRSNAAQPIPATGLRPRGAGSASPLTAGERDAAVEGAPGAAAVNTPEDDESTGEASPPPQPDEKVYRNVGHAAADAGLDDDGRHDLTRWASAGRVSSSKELTVTEAQRAIRAATAIKRGDAEFVRDGEVLLLVDPQTGFSHDLQRAVQTEEAATATTLTEERYDLKVRLTALGDAGKAGWKAAGLPALSKLTVGQVAHAFEVVADLEGRPF